MNEFQNQSRRAGHGLSPIPRTIWLGMITGILAMNTVVLSPIVAQDPFQLPRLMDQDPKYLRIEPEVVLSKAAVPLWIKALHSRNIPLQRKSAESFVIAKRRGFEGMEEAVKDLRDKFNNPDTNVSVRTAVAKALVAIEGEAAHPETTTSFLNFAKSDPDIDLQSIIQPALARWKYSPAKDFWNTVLEDSGANAQSIVWAIEGLTAIQDMAMADRLRSWLEEPANDYRIRFASARSLGQLKPKANIDLAAQLQRSQNVSERILSALLVQQPAVENALPVCLELAKDSDSAVCAIAWEYLVKSEKARSLDSMIDFGMKHRESKVRNAAVELLKLWKTEEAVSKLGLLLSDLHPSVRNNARQGLLKYAKTADLKPAVIQAATNRLEFNWQGIQQGLLILTELDHKPVAVTLVELLEHARPEVHITTGWALERLSVPGTLLPVLKFTERQVTRIKGGGAGDFSKSQYESLAHLIQLLGKNKYQDMEKVIVPKLIPKDQNIIDEPIRPAAIWSIGQIYQGKELPKKYQDQLVERLMDETYMDEESDWVKQFCAHTFGMTKCKPTIPNLEKYAGNPNSLLPFYCHWALNQIDGREIPKFDRVLKNDPNWFLSPLD